MGNHQRKVGQYENSLNGLEGILAKVVPGFGQFSSAAKTVAEVIGFMPTASKKAEGGISNLLKSTGKTGSVMDAATAGINNFKIGVSNAGAKIKEAALGFKNFQTGATAAAAASDAAAVSEEHLATAEGSAAESATVNTVATKAQTVAQEGATVATEGTSVAMRVLKFALASTGIGLLIVAIGSLVAYFEETNEGGKKVKASLAALGAVFQQLFKLIAPIGKAIADAFSDTAGVEFLTSALKAVLIPLRTIVEVLTDIAHGNFKQAFIDLGQGIKDSVVNQVQGFKAGVQLTKDMSNNLG